MKSLSYSALQAQVEELKTQFERRSSDRYFEGQGGRVIYGLDNDVITLITAPWRTAYQKFLNALLDGDDEAPEALAYVFSEFFLSLTGRFSYVIVHPAENELEGMWNHVYIKAENDREELLGGFDFLQQGDIPTDEKHFFDLVKRTLECVYGKGGAITELRRISRVLELECVRRMDAVLDADGNSPFPKELPEDTKVMKETERRWLDALNRVRPTGGGDRGAEDAPSSNLVDAAVLARVEWTNHKFLSTDSKIRLCLVTGDSHIERVAAQQAFHGASFAGNRSPSGVM